MNNLFIAIYTRWNATAGASARSLNPGGLFQGRGPEGVTTPYTVVIVPSDNSDDTMSSTHIEPLVEFTTFDDNTSPQDCWAANAAVRDLYADQLLTVTGWTTIRAQVENPGASAWNDDSKTWQVTSNIRYRLGK